MRSCSGASNEEGHRAPEREIRDDCRVLCYMLGLAQWEGEEVG